MNKKISTPLAISIIVISVVISGGGILGYQYYSAPKISEQPKIETTQPVACTQEAKLCSDGSYVGRTGPNCEFAPCSGQIDKTDEIITDNSTLGLDFASYKVGCMVKDCKPNYSPILIEHLTLKAGDKFGTAEGYEQGNLFQLVSFDNEKIVVKLVKHVSPLVNKELVKVGSDSQFLFYNSSCFALNNWVDSSPNFCLARSSANIDLNFDVISNL